MKDKKRYEIITADCIVSHKCGIKEHETFSFLSYVDIYTKTAYKILLSNQIDFYNEFCPEDYEITKFENENFEKVGEIWL